MRGKDLLEDIGYISDELIEESMILTTTDLPAARKKHRWRNWCAAAACAAVLVISAISFQIQLNRHYEGMEGTQKIEDMDYELHQKGELGINNTATEGEGAEENAAAGLAEAAIESASDGSITDTTGVTDYAASAEKQSGARTEDGICGLPEEKTAYEIIESFPPKQPLQEAEEALKDESASCYAAPEKGKYYYFQELKDAMEYYDDAKNTIDGTDSPQIAYQVAVDVFGERTDNNSDSVIYGELSLSDSGRALLEKEYQRLLDEGYTVSLSENYKLSGIFTKLEFDTFKASSEYGYVFRFEDES